MDEVKQNISSGNGELETQAPRIRKFEIAVYNVNEENDSKPQLQRVSFEQPVYIEATSPKDLQEKLNLYKQCGQIAKPIREIDVNTDSPLPNGCSSMSATQRPISYPVQASAISNSNSSIAAPYPTQRPSIQEVQKQKPKFFKVGDIDVKDDNGKLYEKQWMKLSDAEASNIRIVNDKNNSIVNLTGKHIEMKKWVLIENIDEQNDLEDNL